MRRSDVVDSPWFWALVFSAVGLVGVWAISAKYDDRQKRLEARYEARQRIAEQRARGVGPSASPEQAANVDAEDDSVNDDSSTLQVGYSRDRQVPLRFLAAGLLLLSITSAVMLWRNQRATKRAKT